MWDVMTKQRETKDSKKKERIPNPKHKKLTSDTFRDPRKKRLCLLPPIHFDML